MLTTHFTRFTIKMSEECMRDCSAQGRVDAEVEYWAPIVRGHNLDVKAEDVREELKEYGAWTEQDLLSDIDNWRRIVWCAACSIKDEISQTEDNDVG